MNRMTSELAACGLVCAACRKYTAGKCPGCRDNVKAAWCDVRRCVIDHGWRSCADCTEMPSGECRKFDNFMGKLFGLIFRSDRRGCIERIREVGYEAYLSEMKLAGRMNRPVTKR